MNENIFDEYVPDQLNQSENKIEELKTKLSSFISGNKNKPVRYKSELIDEYDQTTDVSFDKKLHDELDENQLGIRHLIVKHAYKEAGQEFEQGNIKKADEIHSMIRHIMEEIKTQTLMPLNEQYADKYHEALQIVKDIFSGKIYSSRYITVQYWGSEFDYLEKILVSIFYEHQVGKSILAKDKIMRSNYTENNIRYEIEAAKQINQIMAKEFYDTTWIFSQIQDLMKNVEKDIQDIEAYIQKTISALSIPELYELMEHRFDPRYNLSPFYGNNKGEILAQLSNCLKDDVTREVRNELTLRAKSSNGYVEPKGILYFPPKDYDTIDDEIYRMRVWAWNYMLIFRPEDPAHPISEDMKELDAAVYYLVDILPPLFDYYSKRWSSFSKRYHSKNRTPVYESQLDRYLENNGKVTYPYQMLCHYSSTTPTDYVGKDFLTNELFE